MTIYKDISNKIESSLAAAINDVSTIASADDIPILIVGASARDIFFEYLFNVRAPRATNDTDVAIRVSTWDAFQGLEDRMLSSNLFTKDKKKPHRFYHKNGYSFDIVPFGNIEEPKGNIRWPSNQSDMSTLGFEEALNNALLVKIATDVVVPVTTPPSLLVLKLITFGDNPDRLRDAKDIDFILNQYINTGIEQRLSGEDQDVTKLEDFDFSMVGPRLMGRDIGQIGQPETIEAVLKILEKETNEGSYCRLVRDMMGRERDFDEEFAEKLMMLTQLKLGIVDSQKAIIGKDGKH